VNALPPLHLYPGRQAVLEPVTDQAAAGQSASTSARRCCSAACAGTRTLQRAQTAVLRGFGRQPTLRKQKTLRVPNQALESTLTNAQTLVRQAEAEFLTAYEQDLSAIEADPDTLARVREKRANSKLPLEPRMTPENAW
jgi:hypothetical protein